MTKAADNSNKDHPQRFLIYLYIFGPSYTYKVNGKVNLVPYMKTVNAHAIHISFNFFYGCPQSTLSFYEIKTM